MTVQRQTNPLPAGRYWLDVVEVPEGQIADFEAWARDSGSLVRVEHTEEHDADGGTPKRAFFIFRVSAPGAVFDAQRFGFPNIATDDVRTEQDTSTVRDALDAVDADAGKNALRVALIVGGVGLAVGLGIYFATRTKVPASG